MKIINRKTAMDSISGSKRDLMKGEINREILRKLEMRGEPTENRPIGIEICGYPNIKKRLTTVQKELKKEGWNVILEYRKVIDVYVLYVW